jgi:transcriptional regulator with XRE-family HTH domain
MTQVDWQERLTRVIAGEVRRYRHELKMSAQKLADECERLGFPIPRSVLANLEHGRREAVSVAELLVLAAALRVPPILLVIPVARQESVEILPGVEAPAWPSALWWRGEATLQDSGDGPKIMPGITRDTPISRVQAHQDLVVKWSEAYRLMSRAARDMQTDNPDEQDPFRYVYEAERENLDHFETELTEMRAEMRDLGLTPPALPQELAARIDQIERAGGHHGAH